MSELSKRELRIITYSLSRMCEQFERENLDGDTVLKTKIHTWKHSSGIARVQPVQFKPNEALHVLGQCVSILEEPDEPSHKTMTDDDGPKGYRFPAYNMPSTLDPEVYETILRPGRIQGNTTRQTDWAIQKLFDNGAVIVLDHYDDGQSQNENKNLTNRITRRLSAEHGMTSAEVKVAAKEFRVGGDPLRAYIITLSR